MQQVYVGLSGGVDSSVTAALLRDAGYKVTGVFMKNWSKDLPGFECPWFEEYQDAKRVAVQLRIPFKMFDFETEYKRLVVDYMIEEYRAGRTPNPDIMCNQEVKFRLFTDAAFKEGADYVATGHYARTSDGALYKAEDESKDQTYFLYRVNEEVLEKTLFPLGDIEKTEVRRLAKKYSLVTAKKKESMGICFVGSVGIKEFLSQYVEAVPGQIIDQNGLVVGTHEGAIFYTIGQRHGLNTGGGLPYYVTSKDMNNNIVYVTTKLDDPNLWQESVWIESPHWINQQPVEGRNYQARCRHRGELIIVNLRFISNRWQVDFGGKQRRIADGQSIVIYEYDRVVGGGFARNS